MEGRSFCHARTIELHAWHDLGMNTSFPSLDILRIIQYFMIRERRHISSSYLEPGMNPESWHELVLTCYLLLLLGNKNCAVIITSHIMTRSGTGQ